MSGKESCYFYCVISVVQSDSRLVINVLSNLLESRWFPVFLIPLLSENFCDMDSDILVISALSVPSIPMWEGIQRKTNYLFSDSINRKFFGFGDGCGLNYLCF